MKISEFRNALESKFGVLVSEFIYLDILINFWGKAVLAKPTKGHTLNSFYFAVMTGRMLGARVDPSTEVRSVQNTTFMRWWGECRNFLNDPTQQDLIIVYNLYKLYDADQLRRALGAARSRGIGNINYVSAILVSEALKLEREIKKYTPVKALDHKRVRRTGEVGRGWNEKLIARLDRVKAEEVSRAWKIKNR